ncbi:MAG: glycerophosphodiester phosphodiesterase [Acidobacteria bacterium]|nr:glycerophosphodiester phosphodiesterase [Acidobacteriota bacterium]
MRRRFPLIIAHRGAPGRRENTIEAFLHGIAAGAEWIELDVHQTADGAVIVHHDPAIGRRRLTARTLEEARELARRRKRIALATLDDVLEAIPKTIGVNVEIKDPRAARAVVNVLNRHKAVERALGSSFHWEVVRELARLRPRIRTGILTPRRLDDPVDAIRRARASVLIHEYHSVEAAQVREVQAAGFWFVVWTPNRERELRRMVELGVDGIATDYPERLARIRDDLRG